MSPRNLPSCTLSKCLLAYQIQSKRQQAAQHSILLVNSVSIICPPATLPPCNPSPRRACPRPGQVFEQKYYEELRTGKGAVSEATQFQYACCLVRSGYAADVRKGVQMLSSLLQTPSEAGGGQTASQRDYLYFLAVGCAKVKVCTREGRG